MKHDYDINGVQLSCYGYDASGERFVKYGGWVNADNVNGQGGYYCSLYNNAMLYASPYVVPIPKGYTKHYYAGFERIASRIGGGGLDKLHNHVVNPEGKLMQMNERVGEGWRLHCFCREDAEPERSRGLVVANPKPEKPVELLPCSENEYTLYFKTDMFLLYEYRDIHHDEKETYFYHPDHLGSSSWITNQDGDAIQHLQYLPFGEPYVDQRTTGWNAPYTFSGKERDEETGYGYFGARYYDSDLSVWLSVDPLAGKYPSWSPYNYCLNNPIKLVDPNGEFPIKMHKQMVKDVLSNTSLDKSAQRRMSFGTGVRADVFQMFNKSTHLDNRANTDATCSGYQTMVTNFTEAMANGNYSDAGVALHTVADFYSHSNYIPLYQEYAERNGLSMDINDIPTFSEAMDDADLMNFIENNGGLVTGKFPGSGADSHRKMNLDKNSGNGAKPYDNNNPTGRTKHEAAKAVAIKDLKNIAKEYE